MVYVKFNNNNVWEIVPDPENPNYRMKCYKREMGNKVNIPIKFDFVIDEDMMGQSDENINNFNYSDWKDLIGTNKLKAVAANFNTEQSSLPLIYFMKYVIGFNDDHKMERVNSTRYIFWK